MNGSATPLIACKHNGQRQSEFALSRGSHLPIVIAAVLLSSRKQELSLYCLSFIRRRLLNEFLRSSHKSKILLKPISIPYIHYENDRQLFNSFHSVSPDVYSAFTKLTYCLGGWDYQNLSPRNSQRNGNRTDTLHPLVDFFVSDFQCVEEKVKVFEVESTINH